MPELPEVRIMSDFINNKSAGKIFNKIWNVEKGNIPNMFSDDKFKLNSISNGKELILNINSDTNYRIYVFMGMSGNWNYVPTSNWNNTKYIRLKLDDETGNSLILHGGFMGPKYSIKTPFTGIKRGPDPIKNYIEFKDNILNNLQSKDFDKPIFECLLNQKYFNGIGNYLRSTIIYYLDINPFQKAKDVIVKNPNIIEMCRDICLKSYLLNGGQLKDWKNPFDTKSDEFNDWVYYKKGKSIKDSNNRTFWFNPKWIT